MRTFSRLTQAIENKKETNGGISIARICEIFLLCKYYSYNHGVALGDFPINLLFPRLIDGLSQEKSGVRSLRNPGAFTKPN